MKICACYPRDCVTSSGDRIGEQIAYTNNGSLTQANIGGLDSATSGRAASDLPGEASHNVDLMVLTWLTPDDLVRDATNWDFRPLPSGPLDGTGLLLSNVSEFMGASYTEHVQRALSSARAGLSPEVGAYDVAARVYWIPGKQAATAASRPVPPHNATRVRPSADLMFLPASSAVTHHVYLGVAGRARRSSPRCWRTRATLPPRPRCWSLERRTIGAWTRS